MSVIMQIAPIIVEGIFSVIKSTASKIRDTARKVKGNKYQCTRLSERIDFIVQYLQTDRLLKPANDSLKRALELFAAFLQRCLAFVKKFTKINWLHHLIRNRTYHQDFQQLNQELSQHCQDLNFGLAYHLYKIFAKEDAEDVHNDLQDVSATIKAQQSALSLQTQANLLKTNIPVTTLNQPVVPVVDQWNLHQRNHIRARYATYPMHFTY